MTPLEENPGGPMGDRWAENNVRLGRLPAITSQKRQWEQQQQEQVDDDYEDHER